MNVLNRILLLCLSSLLLGCIASKPYHNDGSTHQAFPYPIGKVSHEVYLMGDLDIAKKETDLSALFAFYDTHLNSKKRSQHIVYLGNTIAYEDIPDEDSKELKDFHKRMASLLKKINPKGIKCHFIPGNKEWQEENDYTLDAIKGSYNFLDEISDGKIKFHPKKGCGEPHTIEVNNDLILVLGDSQWLMQGNAKGERKKSSCDIDNNAEYIAYLKDIVGSNKKKNIVFAQHHPLFSNGTTAGNFPVKDHFIPLPILGTMITGLRKIAGNSQQFGHPSYEAYRSTMESVMLNCENCISVSSHDRFLQHNVDATNHHIIAGSPTGKDFARRGDGASFVYAQKGFTRLSWTEDNELWLELIALEAGDHYEVVYRKMLHKKEEIKFSDTLIFKDKSEYPDSMEVVASEWYGKKRFLRGEFYRGAWSSRVKLPLLWIDEAKGGLKPVQQGGGFQTKSLRLENEKGQQWVLRSINKDVEKVVPPGLRGTFAQDLVQDGIAAAHPYGAFVIPVLAEAAKIYHANPIPVYLPHQKALGKYDSDFAERLYLFEERPGGNTEEFEDYGFTKKTLSTLDLIEKLSKSAKHIVDQKAVWRARLFDILIGDWDRHDDQWRWASFEDEDITTYQPIPRDRDQVFFKNDGVLDYLASLPYINPGLRKFDKDIDFYPGLIFNARHFDRSFMHELSLDEVLRIAEELQQSISDDVMLEAFEVWPKNIRELDADEIIMKLKSRRAKLKDYAAFHYKYINKEITVSGTEDEDIFELVLLGGDRIELKVYHKELQPSRLLYSKIIDASITRELRLFGLKKKDVFKISGNHKSSIKIRIIGGSGNDTVVNNSTSARIIVYDKEEGMKTEGNHVKSKIKDVKGNNKYDRKDWGQDRFIQFPMLSFYTDEGVGLSYNVLWKKFGFRKSPFQSNHNLKFAFYAANQAVVSSYRGYFPQAINAFDFSLSVDIKGPTFTQFYYGLGNRNLDFESLYPGIEDAGDLPFHVVRGVHIDINPSIIKSFAASQIRLNPSLEYFNLNESSDDERFYLLDDREISPGELEGKTYISLGMGYAIERLDSPSIPNRGFSFELALDGRQNLADSQIRNLNLSTNLKTYFPFSQKHSVVLAMNTGSAITFGEYEFFHANYLANKSRLRAYKTNRFAGDKMVYHSMDVRFMLSRGKGPFPVSFGLFTSFDVGRVWYEGDTGLPDADKWHSNFGGGIFLTPLDQIGFKIAFYKASRDSQLSIGGSLAF